MVKEKNIVLCILLTFITCGIYEFIWMADITDDTNALSDIRTAWGGTAVLYTILTCGIYGFYWIYKVGDKIDNIKNKKGMVSSNTGILYLLLYFFGFGIVAFAIAQSEINSMNYNY